MATPESDLSDEVQVGNCSLSTSCRPPAKCSSIIHFVCFCKVNSPTKSTSSSNSSSAASQQHEKKKSNKKRHKAVHATHKKHKKPHHGKNCCCCVVHVHGFILAIVRVAVSGNTTHLLSEESNSPVRRQLWFHGDKNNLVVNASMVCSRVQSTNCLFKQ